jgi:hypothetical protein
VRLLRMRLIVLLILSVTLVSLCSPHTMEVRAEKRGLRRELELRAEVSLSFFL